MNDSQAHLDELQMHIQQRSLSLLPIGGTTLSWGVTTTGTTYLTLMELLGRSEWTLGAILP